MPAYLEFPCFEGFLDEVKRRGIGIIGLIEISKRREVFEERLFRLTAHDKAEGLILRCDIPLYYGFQLDKSTPEHELEKYRQSKQMLESKVRQQLEALNLRVVEGEYRPKTLGDRA